MFSQVVLSSLLLIGTARVDEDWSHWRGPHFDGSTEAENLPTEFSRTEGVLWKLELPGPGASTPIVSGGRVYLTAIEPEGGQLVAVCVDEATGETLWQKPVSSGYRPKGAGEATWIHPRSNYASPSPVTDGRRVVFFFGNGDLMAFSPKGEQLWARNLQKDYGDFCFQWTFSSSPTLFEDRLYLQILQRDEPVRDIGAADSPSFLLALDPDTGKEIFKHVRPSPAVRESLESYATPIPHVKADGSKEILVVGGDVLTGHDPTTGKELWRWGTWNPGHREVWWRLVPSVVIGDGVALVCAPKKAPVYAVRLGGEGDLGEDGLVWKSDGRPNPVSSDVPTPLFYRGKFYVLSDVNGSISQVAPKTGEVEWTRELPGRALWRSSPTGADGKIWLMNHAGEVTILDAKSGDILNRIPMGDEDEDRIRSSLAIANDRLFIRTNTHLFCVGARKDSGQ
ncbi:MAG: PQQ-binding-like beta-propeller repeat protein [Planctomycetota bacterium]